MWPVSHRKSVATCWGVKYSDYFCFQLKREDLSSTSLTSTQWNAGCYSSERFFHLTVEIQVLKMQLVLLRKTPIHLIAPRNPLAAGVIFRVGEKCSRRGLQHFWIVLRSILVIRVCIVYMHLAPNISARLGRVLWVRADVIWQLWTVLKKWSKSSELSSNMVESWARGSCSFYSLSQDSSL